MRRGHNRIFGNPFLMPNLANVVNEILDIPTDGNGVERAVRPAANIIKNENDYTIQLALPGVAKEDVAIEIENNRLVVHSKVDEDEKNYRLREFNYANFKRVFTLNEEADTDNISAEFKDGILHLTVPVKEVAKTKKIEIA